MGIFRKKHKHKWIKESWVNKRNHMVWYIRRCACGAVEIYQGGGSGDKKWHPFDNEYKFRFDWEKIWFDEAKMVIGDIREYLKKSA